MARAGVGLERVPGMTTEGQGRTVEAIRKGPEGYRRYGKFKKAEHAFGEMAEWLKAHAWKACLGETLTWVRIPLSPP